MTHPNRRHVLTSLALAFTPLATRAQKRYDPGASDTEIRIGQTVAYSGPASAFGVIGKVPAAYFRTLNDAGGINGRKIRFISLDDGYSPPKTVELTRRLVEEDQVLFTAGSVGTATNSAIHRYMNQRKVPQLFLASGGTKWNDPKNFPWTLALTPSYSTEGKLYAQHAIRTRPQAKVAVLYQNDDFGKDFLQGIREGLGDRAATAIVGLASYEVTDATADSQIVTLQASGADTFFNLTTPKFAAQAIRRIAEVGWKPVHYLVSPATSLASVLKPAGLQNAVGVISAQYMKSTVDPAWADDPGMKDYFAFMKKYLPELDPNDSLCVFGLTMAELTAHVVRQAGDDLTRENILHQATSLKNPHLSLTLPGVTAATSPGDYRVIKSMRLARFDGTRWLGLGEPISIA